MIRPTPFAQERINLVDKDDGRLEFVGQGKEGRHQLVRLAEPVLGGRNRGQSAGSRPITTMPDLPFVRQGGDLHVDKSRARLFRKRLKGSVRYHRMISLRRSFESVQRTIALPLPAWSAMLCNESVTRVRRREKKGLCLSVSRHSPFHNRADRRARLPLARQRVLPSSQTTAGSTAER